MFQETIVLTLAYVLIVAIAFAPKCPHVSPDGPVEYFPEVETILTLSNDPIPSLGNSLVTTTSPLPQAIATDENSLASLGIRELKKIASSRKIPRYGSKTKKELILALT